MINVSSNGLDHCSGCGLCESICHVNAIAVKEKDGFLRPSIDNSKCVSCEQCLNFCPCLKDVSLVNWSDYKFIGWGHTNDISLRREAASGGLVTTFLIYLLKNKKVDYIITSSVYNYDRNLSYSVITEENIDDLYKLSGSNYCPCNIGRSLGEIKKRDGKCAIVCLPCLARGINLLRKADKVFENKILYVISLLCNHVPNYEATGYLLKKYNVGFLPSKVKYRGDGWFGNFRAYSENGMESISIPFSEYFVTKFSEYGWQKSCVDCRDHFGIIADMSVGDADFVKYRNPNADNDGESIWFSNNDDVVKIIQDMSSSGIFENHSDFSKEDMDLIYGPLSQTDRASLRNTRCDFMQMYREEIKAQKKEKMRQFIKRLIGKR